MKILILNGPNLNLLGRREPSVYGNRSFDEYFQVLQKRYAKHDLEYFQSNSEGEIISKIHQVGFGYDGIVLTPVPTPTPRSPLRTPSGRSTLRWSNCISPTCMPAKNTATVR